MSLIYGDYTQYLVRSLHNKNIYYIWQLQCMYTIDRTSYHVLIEATELPERHPIPVSVGRYVLGIGGSNVGGRKMGLLTIEF